MTGPYVLDRVKETSATTGTGTYTLAGAAAGFQAFSAVGDGNTCFYAVENGTDWEVGIGTYTLSGTTLARTTILASSNANAAVNWGAGTKNVFVTAPAGWFGTPLTPGSLLFAKTNGVVGQDNANAFWDDTQDFLGLGTATPAQRMHVANGHIRFDHVAAPAACAAALAGAGAGNVENGTHSYRVTFVTAAGESAPGVAVCVTVADKTTNGQVSLTSIATGTAGVVTSRKVYRSKAGGSIHYLLTTIADNITTTFVDNVADASLGLKTGAQPTTAGKIFGSSSTSSIVLASADSTPVVTGPFRDRGGAVRNVKGYGAVAGTTLKSNGSMTAASATLTSTGFAAADVGKSVSVSWAGTNQIANPTVAATVVVTGGGSTGGILAAGDYRVKYTWTTRWGETTGGTSESTVFTVVYGNIPRVTIPALPTNAIAANIYLTPVGGTTNTEVQYAFGCTATTYDLALTERSDGEVVPTTNRTAGPLNSVIKTFTNSTTVVLADAATTTVSSADAMWGWDDTDAIQEAIDGGTGFVTVPQGNYIISQLRLKHGVWLRGTGNASVLYQLGGFNGHMIIADDNTVELAGVTEIKLHGKKLFQTTVNDGIHIEETGLVGDAGHTIYRVRIEQCGGNGIYIGDDVRGCLVFGNYCLYNDEVNLFIDSASDNLIIGNIGGHSGLEGCKIDGNNNNFLSNKMFWSGQKTTALGYAFHVTSSANNNELTGCTGQDSQSHDLYLNGCDRTAVGNFIFDNSRQDAARLNNCTDCAVQGTSLSFVRNQRTSILNLVGGATRNFVRIAFDAGAVATGNQYVQGTVTGNDVHVGPDGGYQAPTFPTTRTWTVVAATDVITTSSAHGLNVNEPVYVTNSGGALPVSTPQIAINTLYYVKTTPAATTLTLSATPGGATIDFTGTGTGTHTMQLPLQPNPYNGIIQAMTLTGDMPIALPQKSHQGQRLAFQLTQDATGGRKTGFSSAYSILEFLPRTSASRLNIIEYTYNGTTWVQTGGFFSANQTSRLPADATTTSTTLVDVADASSNKLQFQIGDSEVWSFEFCLRIGVNTGTAGMRLALTVPAGATFMAVEVNTLTGPTAFTSSVITASATAGVISNTVATQAGSSRITGTIANGATDGFVTLQFLKVTSNTATVAANSYLNARRIS